MRKSLVSVFVSGTLLLAFIGMAHAAQWANPDLLVTPEIVEKNITNPDWVVVDCRRLEDYAKGHIPGAISFGKECGKALRDGTLRVFRDISKYEKILGKVGIGNNTHVVFYSDDKKENKMMEGAAIGFWILEYLGHDKAHVLNGGLDVWVKAGKKLDTAPTIKKPTTFKANVVKSRIATTEEVLKIAKGQTKGVQLIDSRTDKEYKGEDIRAIRGGHIPNTTINISHLDTLDKVKDPATQKDKPIGSISPDIAAKVFESLDKNKRTIASCQTGSRSTQTYLQLRLLGFKDPANYDDSWVIWGSAIHKGYPVEDEEWFNLARVKELEDKVKALEEKLEKLSGEKK